MSEQVRTGLETLRWNQPVFPQGHFHTLCSTANAADAANAASAPTLFRANWVAPDESDPVQPISVQVHHYHICNSGTPTFNR